MHAFVVAGTRPGCAIPARSLAVLRDGRPAELTFAPDAHRTWAGADGRVHAAGWQDGAAALGVGDRWEARPSGLTAFSGLVWMRATPWGGEATWAAQLADVLAREPLRHLASDLDGVGAVASLGADGSGTVLADPLGLSLLYVAETPEMVVVGTRAALVARVVAGAGERLARDVEGAGWMAYSGNLQMDRTSFEGVRTVPAGSVVRFATDRAPAIEAWSTLPWDGGERFVDGAAVEDAIDAAVQHLRSLARLTATVAPAPTLELTGGRDSRLVLSLLLAEGLAHQVDCTTWGEPELPDVVVASEIADRLDLYHRTSARPGGRRRPPLPRPAAVSSASRDGADEPDLGRSLAERYEAQLRTHLWRTSGSSSIWDLLTGVDRPTAPVVGLTGLFGEALRTTFPRSRGIDRSHDLHAAVAAGWLRLDGARLLRPEVRRHYDRLLCEQLDAMVPLGGAPQDALDAFAQVVRLRRWLGPIYEHDRRNRTFPLYSLPAMRVAFALGPERRHDQLLPFEIMRRCSDELARLPFAGAGWSPGATVLAPDPTSYPTEPLGPSWQPQRLAHLRYRVARVRRRVRGGTVRSTHDRQVTSVVEVGRMRDVDAKVPVLRAFADLDRNHALFDLVDRRALHRSIDELADLSFLARRAVHDAVTAAMWLSGAEDPGDALRT